MNQICLLLLNRFSEIIYDSQLHCNFKLPWDSPQGIETLGGKIGNSIISRINSIISQINSKYCPSLQLNSCPSFFPPIMSPSFHRTSHRQHNWYQNLKKYY